MDQCNDGHRALIIGSILNVDKDFEIWTLVDSEPAMLVQDASRNRYMLRYAEKDNMRYIVNESSNNAFNSTTYYLTLNEGKLRWCRTSSLIFLPMSKIPGFRPTPSLGCFQ